MSSPRCRQPTGFTLVGAPRLLRWCAPCGRWRPRYVVVDPLVHADLRALQRLRALIAGQVRGERLATAEMGDHHGRAFGPMKPLLTALQRGDEHREERSSLFGELIADACGPGLA